MNVYKLTVMVIDFDNIGESEVVNVIENTRYPNRCITPKVSNVNSRDIGEWGDGSPLNSSTTRDAEFERLFNEPEAT